MKKLLFILISVCVAEYGFAQAKPAYNQYVMNNFILNPAMAGIENYVDVKVSNRTQWTGIAGAPNTTYISLHGPIGKSDYRTSATSFDVPGVNPRGSYYWDEYSSKADPHHGVGFTAMVDKAGYINRWSIGTSYAYHRPISKKTTIALGFTAALNGINVDAAKATFSDGQPDLAFALATGQIRRKFLEFGGGLWVYSHRAFGGVSILNIVPGKKNKFTDAANYGTFYTPNFFATVGYRFPMGDDFSFIPSVSAQYWEPQLFGAHANAKVQYLDKAWIGGSYRYSDFLGGYSAMAGFYVSSVFNVSYSYEVATNTRLRTYTNNTHEIMVGLTFNNRYKDNCPRNIF
jgi:type IX secretion system PorP/SprF family membrane protein